MCYDGTMIVSAFSLYNLQKCNQETRYIRGSFLAAARSRMLSRVHPLSSLRLSLPFHCLRFGHTDHGPNVQAPQQEDDAVRATSVASQGSTVAGMGVELDVNNLPPGTVSGLSSRETSYSFPAPANQPTREYV